MNFNSEKREIIIRCISKKAMSVKEIVAQTNITKAHVMATLKKLVEAKMVETYQDFDPALGKNVSYYIRREQPGSNTRQIKGINQADFKKQSEFYRENRNASKNYVGISPIYNG